MTANTKFETRRHARRSDAEKRRIIAEADVCTRCAELSALCRREKIQTEQISAWRRRLAESGIAGLADRAPVREPSMSPEALEPKRVKRENERLRRELSVKDDLLALQERAFVVLDRLDGENER